MSAESGGSEELIARLKAGDEEALARTFSEHRERLRRMVEFRMDPRLSSRLDADDVLQEAYLNAAQRISHFAAKEGMSPFAWLRMIVIQTMIDAHRKYLGAQMRDPRREVAIRGSASFEGTSTSIVARLIGDLPSPSQVAMRSELARQLEEAIERMDAIDREVLALRHFEDLSNSEVAEVLGIEQKAASIRYIRALRRLKGILSAIPGFSATDGGAIRG